MKYCKREKEKVRKLNNILFKKYDCQGWWPTTQEPGIRPKYFPGKEGRTVNDDEAFEIIVGSILTQNNSWTNAEKAIMNLSNLNLLNINKIVQNNIKTIANAIIPARYYNQKSSSLVGIANSIKDAGGIKKLRTLSTEKLRTLLLSWNGIGKETADSILCYAFSREVFVVDAYTNRLFQQLNLPWGSYEEIQNLVHQSIPPSSAVYGDLHARIVKLYTTGDVKFFLI